MSKLIGRLSIVLALGWAGSASAIPFEYRADQFSVNGFVEEFDSPNNTFSPWIGGTVTYQDGYAVFTDPGTIVTCLSLTCEFSGIAYNNSVVDSDWVAQSVWSAEYLPQYPSGFFGMYLYSTTGELYAISMKNYSESIASGLNDSPGLSVGFARYVSGDNFLFQSSTIDEGTISGDIIFQLAFNSSLQTISGSVSLDGGQSFINTFDTFSSTGSGRLVLYGDPVITNASSVPTPATLPLLALGLAALGFSRRKHNKHTSRL